MGDRTSSFVISFDAEAGNIDSVLAAFKSSVRSAVSEIQSTTAKVELFSNLEDSVQKAAASLQTASGRVAELKQQIDSIRGAGGTIGADLAREFKLAETAATAASKAYNNQVTQLSALQTKLTAAGVNTGNLAAEQTRLAAALKTATLAAGQQSAANLLGFKSLADVQPQITALTKAFDTLRLSGKLSGTEIAAAQTLLGEKIAAVRAQVSTTSSTFKQQATEVGAFFSSVQGKILGVAVVVGSVVAAFKSVTDEAKAFNQGIAQIGAITTLSRAELAALGEEARALARSIGIDVVDAVKQLGVIVAAGIPADNAIAVLSASAEAAKISQTDLGAAVKLSTTLVNAFGVSTTDLNSVLAIFFQSAKNGGPTLTALSEDLGKLGPLAKQTNTPIEEIAAALQVMVKAGVPATNAITDLNILLLKLNAAPARKELAALGITTTDLVERLNAIGKSGVPVNQILGDLGLSSARSVAGVTALTDGSDKLTNALGAQKDALDLAAKAQAAFADTAEEREKRLKAAFADTAITIGNTIGAGSRYAVLLANLLNIYNNLSPAVRDQLTQQTLLTGIFGALAPVITLLVAAYGRLTASQSDATAAAVTIAAAAARSAVALQTTVTAIQAVVAAQASAAQAAVDNARASFQGFAADLQTQITALQASNAAAIADLNARAAAQIAALDKSTAAEKATAEATLAIQTKLASDRLALIVKNNADILAAVNAAGAAQLAAVADNAEKTKAVDLAVAQAKFAALGLYKGQLAAALADAVGQEQGYVGKLNTIDATREAFSRDLQQKLNDIRNEGLSDFDAYIAKTNQIKQLLADAATEFAKQGPAALALGKTYTDQAAALTGTLKAVVNSDGVAVISSFDIQQKKIELLTAGGDQYKAALDRAAKAATDGKDASVAAIDAIAPKLRDITQQYDDLNEKVKAGLALKITTDEKDIAAAGKAIDDALAAQQHIAKITADVSAIQTQIDALVANLKTGITTGADAQLQGIATALQKLAADAPPLKLKIDDAMAQVDSIKAAIAKIDELKPKLTVDSNVAEIQAAIDNLKLPTESTHTVHIVTDSGGPLPAGLIPGLSLGGGIRRAGEAWQRFAGGGFAFPRLSSAKVPGTGNEDTVPAALPSGAFVIRKAAAQFYGDLTMMRLAMGAFGLRMLASGGYGSHDRGTGTDPNNPSGTLTTGDPFLDKFNKSPFYGDIPAGTSLSDRTVGEISAPNLPSDPKQLAALVRRYVFDVAYAAIADDYFFWKPSMRVMANLQSEYESRPSTDGLERLLRQARAIGLNLGISKNTHVGFDIDGRSWHKSLARDLPPGLSGPLVYEYDFYNRGGEAGTDTVKALLTPGEYVINAPRASELGSAFLYALNEQRLPRVDLAAMLNPAPPQRPQRFAEGGPVGDSWSGRATWQMGMPGAGGDINVKIDVRPGDLFSIDNVRRFLLPVLNEINRRGK